MAVKITAAKVKEFEDELNYKKNEGRKEVILKIQEARAFGDLSENYEYKIAREEQGKLEERIQQLEDILTAGNYEIYEIKDHYDKVELGCTVVVEDIDTDRRQTLQIVGIYESDPNTEPKKISNESPLGKALMGAQKGDEVDFEHKNNTVTYKIVDIK